MNIFSIFQLILISNRSIYIKSAALSLTFVLFTMLWSFKVENYCISSNVLVLHSLCFMLVNKQIKIFMNKTTMDLQLELSSFQICMVCYCFVLLLKRYCKFKSPSWKKRPDPILPPGTNVTTPLAVNELNNLMLY